MSELTDRVEELEQQAQEWEKVRKFGQSLLFPAGDVKYDSRTETPADAVCRLLQELADRRAKDKLCFLPKGVTAEGTYLGVAQVDKASTYDERDMQKCWCGATKEYHHFIYHTFNVVKPGDGSSGVWFGKERDMQKGKVDWDARIAEQKQQLHEMGNPLWDLLERKKHQKEAQAWYESLVDVIPADAPKDWTSEDIVKGCDKCIYRVLPADIEYHYTGKCVQFHGQDVKVDESIPVDQMNMKREASRKHMDRLKEYMEKVSMVKHTLQTLKLADRDPADIAKCEEELKKLHEWYRQSEPEAILVNPFAADHFYKLRGQMVELGLLSEDASDQVAYVAIKDNLYEHAKIVDTNLCIHQWITISGSSTCYRCGSKGLTNHAYEMPSNKV